MINYVCITTLMTLLSVLFNEWTYCSVPLFLVMWLSSRKRTSHMLGRYWNTVLLSGPPSKFTLLTKLNVFKGTFQGEFYFVLSFLTQRGSKSCTSTLSRLGVLNMTWNCVSKLSTIYVALTLPAFLPLLPLPSPEVMNLNWSNLFVETIGC